MQAVSGSQLCLAGPLRLTLPLGSLKKPGLQHYLTATKRFFQGRRGHFLQKERLRSAKLQRMASTVAADDTTRLHDDKRFKPGVAKPFVGDLGVRQGFVDAIGNTPLIRLNRASELTGCEIYGKAEFLNPGGSVKDRAALYLIKDAEEKGLLKPGGIIVEGTAGNTGIGLALVANAKGYKTVIVIPQTQSQEKKDMLTIAGAELIQVPAVPYKNPNNYVKYSGRLAEALAKTNPGGAIWANQFDNPANRKAHYETTEHELWASNCFIIDVAPCKDAAFIACNSGVRSGLPTPFLETPVLLCPNENTGEEIATKKKRIGVIQTLGPEIWAQTEGKVDGFVCAIGTGGTLAGVGKYLKEKNPNVRIGMADPMGAAMYNYYANGELKSEGTSLTEGIGQGRVTGNLAEWGQPTREGGVVDFWCQVTDEEALPIIYDLLRDEGLVMGGSTGINIGGAIKLAKELGPGHTIVTILCDYGTRYQGKIYNVDFLKSKGLPYPEWLDTAQKTSQIPTVFVDPEAV